MIKCIIFDWGGVCTESSHFTRDFSENLASVSGIDSQLIEQVFRQTAAPYEIGLITPEDFWNNFRNILNLELDVGTIQKIFCSAYTMRDGMLEYIVDLKKNYQTALLTNNYQDALASLRQKHHLEQYFDHFVSSCELRCKKPEERIYRYTLRKINIQPEEAVFIDDNHANIMGANKLGIKTIHFKDMEQFKKELKRFII